MYTSVTDQTGLFHIQGGGAWQSKRDFSVASGFGFFVPYFNNVTQQTAPRHCARVGCFLRLRISLMLGDSGSRPE
jgi:hypothetical protein